MNKIELEQYQESFMNSEIWMLVFTASFQRANVYVTEADEKEKKSFKFMTAGHIDSFISSYANNDINDDEHISNIKSIENYSKHFDHLFNGGKINFGIAQKMLNLYLKYLWCLGRIKEPPHFPVDRIIQQELNLEAGGLKLPKLKIEPWTKFSDESYYLEIINHARIICALDDASDKLSLAQLELKLFNRK